MRCSKRLDDKHPPSESPRESASCAAPCLHRSPRPLPSARMANDSKQLPLDDASNHDFPVLTETQISQPRLRSKAASSAASPATPRAAPKALPTRPPWPPAPSSKKTPPGSWKRRLKSEHRAVRRRSRGRAPLCGKGKPRSNCASNASYHETARFRCPAPPRKTTKTKTTKPKTTEEASRPPRFSRPYRVARLRHRRRYHASRSS